MGRADSQLPPQNYPKAAAWVRAVLANKCCSYEALEGGDGLDAVWFSVYHWNDAVSPHLVALMLLNEDWQAEWIYRHAYRRIFSLPSAQSLILLKGIRACFETSLTWGDDWKDADDKPPLIPFFSEGYSTDANGDEGTILS